MIDRRHFLRTTAGAGFLWPLAQVTSFARPLYASARKVHIFSKHLQWLDYNRMAEFVAECGYDGADLTVRPGGHVEPQRVKEDLPRAVKALRAMGRDVSMMTTNILKADDPHTELILQTAANEGIQYYRLGWYSYDPHRSIDANLAEVQAELKKIIALNETYGIKGSYQNHAGVGVGSPVWDIGRVLQSLDSTWIGFQYDIRHAMVEGGNSWPVGFRFVKPFINTLDIKDFYWTKDEKKGWMAVNTPMGTGMVDFSSYFKLIADLPEEIPMCVHMEFDLGGAEHGNREVSLGAQEIMKLMKAELAFVRKHL